MKTFRTLDLAEKFYHLSEEADIKGNLRDQLLRASSSIVLNSAEGNAKPSVKEKKRFYKIAYASLKECQAILRLAKMQESKSYEVADHLGASLWKLLNSEISSIQNSEYS